ncbi:MAG: serine/threonine protein kinase [Pirellulales bacterium]|nr:serine/threonine protein kinase [Pirellulales bacterium]
MSLDQTQSQASEERQHARQLSLRLGRPPLEIPGYHCDKCLGSGAFGEVWVARDLTTGRPVAIKFFHVSPDQDWSQLAREVEKLAFLSADRYVVQLLDVGWDAATPYYVMEYVEAGSLAQRLELAGPLPIEAAVEIFRELAVGLSHAHGKGVLHCDLKPANVLLDQDARPRLADFGQARLAHEQQPACGTLFYMAPEQAAGSESPDARWDVYGLGAILYAMLAGEPPRQTRELAARLENTSLLANRLEVYRRGLGPLSAAEIAAKFQLDWALAEILERCLALDPGERFANLTEVLTALDTRERRRRLWPLVTLGGVGPVVVMSCLALVAWWFFGNAFEDLRSSLTGKALESLKFAGHNVADAAGSDLANRFELVERLAADPDLCGLLAEYKSSEQVMTLGAKLSDPVSAEMQLEPYREEFKQLPYLTKLQDRLASLIAEHNRFGYASWFLTDARGLQVARLPASQTIGQNYAWRTYFHGGARDQAPDWRPAPAESLKRTHLSAVYRSQSSKRWSVAISTPLFKLDGSQEFLGVLALTFEVGKEWIELHSNSGHFTALVDQRTGDGAGLIVQHPLFSQVSAPTGILPDEIAELRVPATELPPLQSGTDNYRDPLGRHPAGQRFAGRWLAWQQPILIRGKPSGWVVVVQSPYNQVLGSELDQFRAHFFWSGIFALGCAAAITAGLWIYALRQIRLPPPLPRHA